MTLNNLIQMELPYNMFLVMEDLAEVCLRIELEALSDIDFSITYQL